MKPVKPKGFEKSKYDRERPGVSEGSKMDRELDLKQQKRIFGPKTAPKKGKR